MNVTDVSFPGMNGEGDADEKACTTTREEISPPPKKFERRGREDRANSREPALKMCGWGKIKMIRLCFKETRHIYKL